MNFNRILLVGFFAAVLCANGCSAVNKQKSSADKKIPAAGTSQQTGHSEAAKNLLSGPPGNQYYYFILSRLEAKAGRKEKAVSLLEKAIEIAPREPVLKRELALFYLDLDREKDALAVAEDLISQAPDDVEALILAGSICQAAGEYRKAMQIYEKVLLKDPERKNIYLALARLYLRNQDYKKAAELLGPFVKRFPENYTGFYFLAEARSGTGQFDQAIEAYEKSLDLKPGLLESRIGLIEIYTSRGEDEKAAVQYKKLLESHPDNVAAAIELGLLYKRLGEKVKAEEIWSGLAGRIPSDQDAILEVVRQFLAGSRYKDAIAVLSEMLKQSPESPELNYFAGAARYMMKQFDAALKHFRFVGPADGLYPDATIHRAIILNRQDKTAEALERLEAAMQKLDDKDRLTLIPYMSAFYQEQGEYENAEKILSKGLSMDPENAELHYEMGVLYDRMGDTDAAVDKMRFVIEMEPENADALNYLGYTFADRGIRLDEAESLIRRALDIEPENGYILDSMGWLYYRKGDYKRARIYIENALEKVPDDPVILEHMGDVYLKLSDRAKALKYYRQARENTGKEENRAELSEKIESLGNKEMLP
ncbi:MAG: tetratricopeptide repeat protein [Desulfobacterales bacterium]